MSNQKKRLFTEIKYYMRSGELRLKATYTEGRAEKTIDIFIPYSEIKDIEEKTDKFLDEVEN